ncbi:MAG: hypothetical protein QOD72_2351 [Acidimicrobiaceae bacterium]|jgi:uncharacterized protein (DUF1330 family)|nr:hypothetical protein [Acidimicrobiaceae bacterium]
MAAYFVVNATITDLALLAKYGEAAGGTVGAHPIKPLVVTNEATILEGEAGERVVVLEFPTREAAMAWYESPEYQAVIGMRLNSTKGFLALVDGFA